MFTLKTIRSPQHSSKNRLASLYSDFSNLKTTNPDGYRANVSAWKIALTNASRAAVIPGQGRLCVKMDSDLLKELELRNLGRPVALDAVIVRLLSSWQDMRAAKIYLRRRTLSLPKP